MKKLLAALLFVPSLVLALPKPTGYVNDFAKVLRWGDKVGIENRISAFHKKTGVEVAVVTIDSLNGEVLEDYANKLFKEWGIGQKGKDNGVLILCAMAEHKIRIEVGYGLEGQLNDSFCGRVIREDMVPQFKQGNFAEGIQYALTTIFHRIED